MQKGFSNEMDAVNALNEGAEKVTGEEATGADFQTLTETEQMQLRKEMSVIFGKDAYAKRFRRT